MEKEFDINQGHGDHNDCLFGKLDDKGCDLVDWIRKMIPGSVIRGRTEGEVKCSLGEGRSDRMPFVLLSSDNGRVRLQALIGVLEEGKQNTLVSAYPECEGMSVDVRLTAIHEWVNGVEATLEGTMLGDEERNVAFFDTRYVTSKGKYEVGKLYRFNLAALCYDDGEIMPEKDRKMTVPVEQVLKICKVTGEEPKRDAEGNVEPWTADMSKGTAYWSTSRAYPDDAYFQSPVFARVRTEQAFERKYLVMEIGIARADEGAGPEVRIPLYARSDIFSQRPHKDDPIRGHMWLHGYLAEDPKGG